MMQSESLVAWLQTVVAVLAISNVASILLSWLLIGEVRRLHAKWELLEGGRQK